MCTLSLCASLHADTLTPGFIYTFNVMKDNQIQGFYVVTPTQDLSLHFRVEVDSGPTEPSLTLQLFLGKCEYSVILPPLQWLNCVCACVILPRDWTLCVCTVTNDVLLSLFFSRIFLPGNEIRAKFVTGKTVFVKQRTNPFLQCACVLYSYSVCVNVLVCVLVFFTVYGWKYLYVCVCSSLYVCIHGTCFVCTCTAMYVYNYTLCINSP